MKNLILKRFTAFGLSILVLLCVLAPVPCFAYSRDVEMVVGETKDFTAPTYTTFTYQWAVESGGSVISIQSGKVSATCKIKAEKEGNAVLKVVYTRTGRLTRSYTNTYKITVSKPSYKVTLDANGGSVYPSSLTLKDGDTINLPTPTRSGYSFAGWFTKTTGGNEIHNGPVSISGNATLYAHWERVNPSPTPNPSPTSDPDPFCPTCGGLGDCPECFGEGHQDCTALRCLGGMCLECSGTGTILSYSMGEIRERTCSYCHGKGECSRCGGDGYLDCRFCHSTGDCPTCHGSGFKAGRSLYD